jgi:hypothetical protein
MICKTENLKVENGFANKVRLSPKGIIGGFKLWLCNKRGTHDFEMKLDEWYDGNVTYDDWPNGTHIGELQPVGLRTAQRWCSRHTILRCSRCGFEWERLFSGVKGCGGHTWMAGKEWSVKWQCLPWGDPNATVEVGTSSIPESVMQINDPELSHLKNLKV